MIDWTPTPEQVNTLLGVLYEAQDALRRLWFTLGLSDSLAGQPVWPWSQRLHGELMGFEPGQARRLLLCVGALVLTPVLLGLALVWRRGRWPLCVGAVFLLAAAPWSVFGLLAGPALPSSFHVSDSGFMRTPSCVASGSISSIACDATGPMVVVKGLTHPPCRCGPPTSMADCCGSAWKVSFGGACATACKTARGKPPCRASPRS